MFWYLVLSHLTSLLSPTLATLSRGNKITIHVTLPQVWDFDCSLSAIHLYKTMHMDMSKKWEG